MTETWLISSIYDHELFSDRYVVYRRDRETSPLFSNKTGGGVLIAIDKHLDSRRENKLESDCEDLWVSIKIRNDQNPSKLYICAVYLPPPVQKQLLDTFIDNTNIHIHNLEHTIIIGDFNLSNINWTAGTHASAVTPQITSHSTCVNTLLDFITLHDLSQYNYVKNYKDRILDLVFANFEIKNLTKSCHDLCTIDQFHPPIEFSIGSFCKEQMLRPCINQRYDFFKADYDNITTQLRKIPWEQEIGTCELVDDMLDVFYARIRELIAKFTIQLPH